MEKFATQSVYFCKFMNVSTSERIGIPVTDSSKDGGGLLKTASNGLVLIAA